MFLEDRYLFDHPDKGKKTGKMEDEKGKKETCQDPEGFFSRSRHDPDREVSLAPHGHQISILELVMTTCAIHGPR